VSSAVVISSEKLCGNDPLPDWAFQMLSVGSRDRAVTAVGGVGMSLSSAWRKGTYHLQAIHIPEATSCDEAWDAIDLILSQ